MIIGTANTILTMYHASLAKPTLLQSLMHRPPGVMPSDLLNKEIIHYTTMITDKMKQMTTMYDDDQRSGWELLDFFIHFLEKICRPGPNLCL